MGRQPHDGRFHQSLSSRPTPLAQPRGGDHGRAHALYLQGCGEETISLRLGAGRWTAEWLSVEDGSVLQREELSCDGELVRLSCPEFSDAVALRILLKSTAAASALTRFPSNGW